ncbi:MAG: hypothetical protein II418_09310, partial [Firmicutes bacterium]|nr:hypothetical protein [Bacillota bacterium]
MFTTPDGLQQLKKKYPKVHAAFIMRTAGLMKSKSIENDVWWRLGDAKKVSDALIKQMNAENGLRTQSWSDFQVKHLMDYIAATIELAARGAKMHAYTKVLDYVRLMGNTGVMINMSLIPKASYNGKLEYDPVEGINYEEAVKLREMFPETAGTICIGIRPNQIRQLMEDMTVDYIIPYHRSGASPVIRERMHIPEWDDFQGNQSEKKLSGEAAEENAKKYGVKLLSESDPNWHKGPKFSDWFDLKKAKQAQKRLGTKGKYGVMTGGYMAMQQAAENYKKICAERGLQPKFSYGVNERGESLDVSDAPNYWKVLIDRKMVNNKTGGIIEQKAIKPVFDMDTVQKILDDELERYPQVKADQDEALNRVVDSFLKGDVNGNMSADEVAKALQKPIENLAEVAATGSQNQMAGPREDWALAADITEQVKKELVGYDGITEAEIDDWLDPDAYFRANGGSLFYRPEEVMDELYALTQEKPGKKANVYRLMDRVLRTMRPVME